MLLFGVYFYILFIVAALAFFSRMRRSVGSLDFSKEATNPIRCLAMISVVASHCDTMTGMKSSLLVVLHMGTPAVALFLFISGYGLIRMAKIIGDKYWNGFIGRSCLKIIVPFFLMATIYVIGTLLNGEIGLIEILASASRGDFDFVLPHCWYVFSIFTLYIAAWFSFKTFGLRNGLICFVVLNALYGIILFSMKWPFCWWYTAMSMSCGAVYAYIEERIEFSRIFYGCQFLITAVFIAVAILINGGIVGKIINPIILVLSGIVIASSAKVLTFARHNKAWCFLAGISYEMYLVHGVPKIILYPCCHHAETYFLAVLTASVFGAMVLKMVSRLLIQDKWRRAYIEGNT